MDIWKRFFPQGVVKLWNGLLREAVTVPSLVLFKEHSDNALRDMV